MLAAAPPTLRRKALALVRTLLEEDDGVLNVDSDATKAKH
jgi:hypothetical protein